MRLIFFFILLTTASVSIANEAFEKGNSLYESGDFKGAIQQYSTIIAEGKHASEVYYNLGNSYYRNKEIGKAIWAYESALKIEPTHEDALFNLTHVNAQTVDKIAIDRYGFGHWVKGLIYSDSINRWAYASLIFAFLFTALFILFFQVKRQAIKNFSLLLAALCLLGLVGSGVLGYLQKFRLTENSEAVVITEKVEIKVSPKEEATTTFVLSEGTKVQVLEKEKDAWIKISLNGNQGWLPSGSIWKI
ncbi:MAG: tetratricopeptide repeat protein [Crocinitomicaceae bacterium]